MISTSTRNTVKVFFWMLLPYNTRDLLRLTRSLKPYHGFLSLFLA